MQCHRVSEEPGLEPGHLDSMPCASHFHTTCTSYKPPSPGTGTPCQGPGLSLFGAVSGWALPWRDFSFAFPTKPTLAIATHSVISPPESCWPRSHPACVLRYLTYLPQRLRVDFWFRWQVSTLFPSSLPYHPALSVLWQGHSFFVWTAKLFCFHLYLGILNGHKNGKTTFNVIYL